MIVLLLIVSPAAHAQAENSAVLQLDAWRKAVLAGDSATLSSLYTNAPRIFAPKQTPSDLKSALDYWTSWKGRGLKTISMDVQDQKEQQPGFYVLAIQLTLGVSENGATKKYFVRLAQGYVEQGAVWKIAAEQREAETRLKAPAVKKDIYPAGVDARKEIAEAIAAAAQTHKRVLLIFGGNWCYDCHVLDLAFRQSDLAPLLKANYEVVHVDIGEYNKNLAIAQRYQVPLQKGVPAIAVLDSSGKLLFSQTHGEFENTRKLGPEDLIAFLNQWKPGGGNP